VDLFFGLQSESPENGSFLGFGWRLLGIFGPKSSTIGLQRLLAMREARIWRAFLIQRRKFSKTRTGWLGREDSNLRMGESKSPALPLGDAPMTGLEGGGIKPARFPLATPVYREIPAISTA
jgi:hypothetical protein